MDMTCACRVDLAIRQEQRSPRLEGGRHDHRHHDLGHRPGRGRRRAAGPHSVRHARHHRRPAGPGPRGDLGHLDFLQVRQDEITRRETLSQSRRLRAARFEQQATLEGLDFAASPKLPAALRDLAALRWLHNGELVILYKPVGVGESPVAQALGHLAIPHGADARSSPPAGRWPTWPAGTPTAPGTNGSASSRAPPS